MKRKKYSILALVAAASIIATWSVVYGGLEDKPRSTPPTAPSSDMPSLGKVAGFRYASTDRDTLVGLQGVRVSVKDLAPEVEKYGLTKQALQTDTELRLRQHSVKVLTEEEFSKLESAWGQADHRQIDAATLYVNIRPLIDEQVGVAAVSVNVQLQQLAFLPRQPKILHGRATTWEQEAVMLCGLKRLNEARGQVGDLVDEFINDYLEAKAKQQSTEEDTTVVKSDVRPTDGNEPVTTEIQGRCMVSRHALADMHICALRYRAATDPNRPEQERTNAGKMGELMLRLQAGYLQSLGLDHQEILSRYIYLIEQSTRNDPAAFAACFDYLVELQAPLLPSEEGKGAGTRKETTDSKE